MYICARCGEPVLLGDYAILIVRGFSTDNGFWNKRSRMFCALCLGPAEKAALEKAALQENE